MTLNPPRFNERSYRDFTKELKQQVNTYFAESKKPKTGDWRVKVKAFVMLSGYWAPFALILAGFGSPWWAYIGLTVVMGIFEAGIGLSVMHDANHGSFSSKPWLNRLMGLTLNMLGANSLSWRIQHNVLHHSFTNIKDFDEDLDSGAILRFSPHTEWKKHHTYQHIYAWALYSLMVFNWIVIKDFVRLKDYAKKGLVESQGTTPTKAMLAMIFTKVLYFGYILALPIALGYDWYLVLAGFMVMHMVAGLMLAMIFQPAHIMENHEFLEGSNAERLDRNYTVHQLLTTTNFATKNRILTWFCGGLNFQIEHHIFPGICHVHYPDLSDILSKTAKKYELPYNSIPTFRGALQLHQSTLKRLGMDHWEPAA